MPALPLSLLLDILWLGPTMIALAFMAYARVRVQRAYQHYQEVPNASGLSGAQIARLLLDSTDLRHVPVEEIDGDLTDHYDEEHRSVRLSSHVTHQASVAALAIAAHEAAHAVQHHDAHRPFQVRRVIAPLAAFSPPIGVCLVVAGLLLDIPELGWMGTLLLVEAVVLALGLIPAERDANRRARILIRANGLANQLDEPGLSAVLNAAPLTYCALLLTSFRHLVYLGLLATGVARREK